MKYVLIIVALFAAGIIGYGVYQKNGDVVLTQNVSNVAQKEEGVFGEPVEITDAETAASVSKEKEIENVPEKPVSNVKKFTMTEVALHADMTSCYSVINNSVYDLTSWIIKHPGGERAIKSICGKDGSDGFNGKHGGKPQPESTLASFKIGSLAQ